MFAVGSWRVPTCISRHRAERLLCLFYCSEKRVFVCLERPNLELEALRVITLELKALRVISLELEALRVT